MTVPAAMTYPDAPAPLPPRPARTAPLGLPRGTLYADVAVTIVLFVCYAVFFAGTLFYSLFWVMASDACSIDSTCSLDPLTNAYVLNDLGGAITFVVCLVVGIVLMCLRKFAFWVPLAGAGIQFVLLLLAIAQLSILSTT